MTRPAVHPDRRQGASQPRFVQWLTPHPLQTSRPPPSCEWIDLTHTFGPGIPHHFAFPDEERETLFHFDDGVGSSGTGFLAHRFTHIGQWGTHVDLPAHFARGVRFLDELPVTDMILPPVVIDVRRQVTADANYTLTIADLEAHEAEAMANRDAEGVAHYPGWGVEALKFLVEDRGATAIGHDTTDTDPGAVVGAGSAPAETYILGADRWQIEMLTGLDQAPPTGALIVATWPKPHERSGFPARVFAIGDRG